MRPPRPKPRHGDHTQADRHRANRFAGQQRRTQRSNFEAKLDCGTCGLDIGHEPWCPFSKSTE